ncbi:MAG: hypothetical protein LUQ25_03255 [Methanoregulaceae archaeon]|nr:hypothetical protein [Methanoregulaceae archaeon]
MDRTRAARYGIIAFLVISIFIQASAAFVEVRSGPGWNLTVREEAVIDPDTGVPYISAGEMLQDRAPDLWEKMSLELKAQYNQQPAVKRRIDLTLTPTDEQMNRTRALIGLNLTEGEFYAAVYPDLWAAIPGWQKDLWANRTSSPRDSGSPAINNSTREEAPGTNQTSGQASGGPSGGAAVQAVSPDISQAGSGTSVDSGGPTTLSSTITPSGTSTRVSGAVGTVSAFASVHSRSRSSSLDYEKFTSASGVIDHFDFSIEYGG